MSFTLSCIGRALQEIQNTTSKHRDLSQMLRGLETVVCSQVEGSIYMLLYCSCADDIFEGSIKPDETKQNKSAW